MPQSCPGSYFIRFYYEKKDFSGPPISILHIPAQEREPDMPKMPDMPNFLKMLGMLGMLVMLEMLEMPTRPSPAVRPPNARHNRLLHPPVQHFLVPGD